MSTGEPSITIEEAADLLRAIARGEMQLKAIAGAVPGAEDFSGLRAGPYSFCFQEEMDELGCFTRLIHDDGRTGDHEGWFATAGRLPDDLLSGEDRTQFEARFAIAQALGALPPTPNQSGGHAPRAAA
jgi:hypothetical protein